MISSINIPSLSNSVLVIGAVAAARVMAISAKRDNDSIWRGDITIGSLLKSIVLNDRCTIIISGQYPCICYNVTLLYPGSEEPVTTIPAETEMNILVEFKSIRLL